MVVEDPVDAHVEQTEHARHGSRAHGHPQAEQAQHEGADGGAHGEAPQAPAYGWRDGGGHQQSQGGPQQQPPAARGPHEKWSEGEDHPAGGQRSGKQGGIHARPDQGGAAEQRAPPGLRTGLPGAALPGCVEQADQGEHRDGEPQEAFALGHRHRLHHRAPDGQGLAARGQCPQVGREAENLFPSPLESVGGPDIEIGQQHRQRERQ